MAIKKDIVQVTLLLDGKQSINQLGKQEMDCRCPSHPQRRIPNLDAPRQTQRKKKPWYSKVFYTRINDLQGAVGFELMERAVELVKHESKG